MIKFVNAKINLGLNIVRKREDGYHDLETLFYPVGLYNGTSDNPEPFCDILEIHLRNNGEDGFRFYGNPVDCPLEKNLVYKALQLFKASIQPHLTENYSFIVSLEKHIPDGAGLGGGSADATFTLLALNELFGNPLNHEELISKAKSLGADCPFFVENRPVLAKGIGEIMTPFPLDLNGYWAVIIKPDIYISTREAFSGIKPAIPAKPITDILSQPVENWEKEGLKNDFENHIFALHPTLKTIKEMLYGNEALYAAMSGSGSSIFGIFQNREAANKCLANIPSEIESVKVRTHICKL